MYVKVTNNFLLLVVWDFLRLPSRVWWACWRVTCLVNHYGSIWWSGADRIWILVSLILIESLLACRLMGDTSIHGYVAQRALWVSSCLLCGVVTVRGCLLCADTCSYSVVGFNSSSLTCWNSWSWLSPKSQACSVLRSSCKDFVRSARFAENFPIIWFTIPMKRQNSNTFVGICIPRMAAVLSESAVIPYSSMTWPRNVSLFWLNVLISGFNAAPAPSIVNTLESCCEPGVVLKLIPAKDHNIVHLTDDPLQTAEVCGHPFL